MKSPLWVSDLIVPPGFRAHTLPLACCLLVVFAVVPAGVAGQSGLQIVDVSIDDGDVVDNRNGVEFLWQSESHTIDVGVETGSGAGEGHYEVCLETSLLENGSSLTLQCKETVLSGNDSETITFGIDAWPENMVGRQDLAATVTDGTLNRNELANASVSLHVLRKAADLDGDGLTNRAELAGGTDVADADTDGDGLLDGLERDTYGTDPTTTDTDGDGLPDGAEVATHETDPTSTDTDGDGLNDAEEVQAAETNPNRADTDGDGLSDADEVHTYETDPLEPDSDGDGLADGAEVTSHETDPAAGDTDGDGLGDALEVFRYETNPNRADTDTDGLDDGAEVYDHHTEPTVADTDGDGLKDGAEAKTHGTNPNRADTDGDGLDDGAEVRTHDTDPTLADTDGDGRSDLAAVEQARSLVPGWGWIALVVIGAAFVAGAVVIRRRGYPAWLRTLGLGRGETGTDAESADSVDSSREETGTPGGSPVTGDPRRSDRVLALLETNDGRMQQSAIVEETGWSKATVSRVLSAMAEDDRIVKITVGRKNIITLPGEEPEQSRRPFETENLEGVTK